jgi:hypothetical protein
VTGILSSARLRRRLLLGGVFLAIAGGVAGLVLAFPSPDPEQGEKMTTVAGDVVEQPKGHSFAPRRSDILVVARKFLLTAVTRHHTGDSWDVIAPSMKQGYTKKSWSRGNIPVPPFPVEFARWRVGYSFESEVDLQVALFPPRKSDVKPAVFDLTLQRVKQQGKFRWLVAQFVPAPDPSGDSGSRRTRFSFLQPVEKPLKPPSHTGALWLLLPGGILSLLLVALAAIGFRSWRSARVYRAHFRQRQMSSSRPS